VIRGFELKASHLLSRCSTTWAMPCQPKLLIVFITKRSNSRSYRKACWETPALSDQSYVISNVLRSAWVSQQEALRKNMTSFLGYSSQRHKMNPVMRKPWKISKTQKTEKLLELKETQRGKATSGLGLGPVPDTYKHMHVSTYVCIDT
jgi:hypothetical protein